MTSSGSAARHREEGDPPLRRLISRELIATVHDYRASLIEFLALRVITRGLFLTVAVMLGFLYVLARLTQVLPGMNEIVVPTSAVPDSTDVGAIVSQLVAQSQGALLGVVGIITLVISANMTANALRRGVAIALIGSPRRPVPYVSALNLGVGLAVALLILLTWLLTLCTALRHAAYVEMLHADVPRVGTNLFKVACTAVQFLLISGSCYVVLRSFLPRAGNRRMLIGAGMVGLVTVLANFLVLYANIAALIDPRTSSGVVLVLTLVTWVNVVVRMFFLVQVWVVIPAAPKRDFAASALPRTAARTRG